MWKMSWSNSAVVVLRVCCVVCCVGAWSRKGGGGLEATLSLDFGRQACWQRGGRLAAAADDDGSAWRWHGGVAGNGAARGLELAGAHGADAAEGGSVERPRR